MDGGVLVCVGTWTETGGGYACNGSASVLDLADYYLLPASAESQAALLINGGFSADGALMGFTGVLTLFAVGLGTGWIVQVIRRLR